MCCPDLGRAGEDDATLLNVSKAGVAARMRGLHHVPTRLDCDSLLVAYHRARSSAKRGRERSEGLPDCVWELGPLPSVTTLRPPVRTPLRPGFVLISGDVRWRDYGPQGHRVHTLWVCTPTTANRAGDPFALAIEDREPTPASWVSTRAGAPGMSFAIRTSHPDGWGHASLHFVLLSHVIWSAYRIPRCGIIGDEHGASDPHETGFPDSR